ncbi:MAG: transcription antitermination factor NusB [Polyangiaceae bacterium]
MNGAAAKTTKRVPTARTVASQVLTRVSKDGAFASAALSTELSRAVQLGERDRALSTELVYGVLRHEAGLLAALSKHTPRGLDGLDDAATRQLLLGAYQLLFLDRVPPHAIVSEAVSEVKRERSERLAGFVNAVLRRFHERVLAERETLRKKVETESRPAWLVSGVARAFGESSIEPFFAWAEKTPVPTLCVRDPAQRDALLARLREARPDATFEKTKFSPHGIHAAHAGSLARLEGYGEDFVVQEEGSQLVGLLAAAKPGEVVLDACAGRGNKTAILAKATLPGGATDACDLHPNKVERLRENLLLQGLSVREAKAVDWEKGTGGLTGPYDRILVDAPCSGTGTISRRPDLLLRRTKNDGNGVAELADLQVAIVKRVVPLLAPRGRLTYAVCSILHEEAEAVVERLLAETDLIAVPFDPENLAASLWTHEDPPTSVRLVPHVHGTDGYFIASFQRP